MIRPLLLNIRFKCYDEPVIDQSESRKGVEELWSKSDIETSNLQSSRPEQEDGRWWWLQCWLMMITIVILCKDSCHRRPNHGLDVVKGKPASILLHNLSALKLKEKRWLTLLGPLWSVGSKIEKGYLASSSILLRLAQAVSQANTKTARQTFSNSFLGKSHPSQVGSTGKHAKRENVTISALVWSSFPGIGIVAAYCIIPKCVFEEFIIVH